VSEETHAVGRNGAFELALFEALSAGRLAVWRTDGRRLFDVVRPALVHVVLVADEVLVLQLVTGLRVLASRTELVHLLVNFADFDEADALLALWTGLELAESSAFGHAHLVAFEAASLAPLRGGCTRSTRSGRHRCCRSRSEVSLPG